MVVVEAVAAALLQKVYECVRKGTLGNMNFRIPITQFIITCAAFKHSKLNEFVTAHCPFKALQSLLQ